MVERIEPPTAGNVVQMRRTPTTGRLTWKTFFPAAKEFAQARGATTPLNALVLEDRQAIQSWCAYLTRIGGEGSALHDQLLRALNARSRRDATVSMPTRWPAEMTGIATDGQGEADA